MTTCSVQTKSISIMTTRLVNKYSSMTKRSMANLNPKLLNPLTFFRSTLMALWQYHCGLVLLNVSMFTTPCHIGSPHLCNLIWNSFFFLIDYGEGECYAQLHLSHDSQESSFVNSNASFFGSLWCHEHVLCTCHACAMHMPHCPSLVLSLCELNALSSSKPTFS